MKHKSLAKKIGVIILVVLMLFSTLISASAYTDASELPHIARWVNGNAADADGLFLRDTWAVDDTGVSDRKYVLVDQEALEAMRVENYPDDISNGETDACPMYKGEFTLTVPDTVEGEVIVTIENDGVENNLYFNEENSYSTSAQFFAGEYSVSEIDVVLQPDVEYVLTDDLTLDIDDKDVSVKLEIIDKATADAETTTTEKSGFLDKLKNEDAEATTKNVSEQEKDVDTTVSETETEKFSVSQFDENGDLLGDTIMLCVAVGVLLVVYLIIKRKREKVEELHR